MFTYLTFSGIMIISSTSNYYYCYDNYSYTKNPF